MTLLWRGSILCRTPAGARTTRRTTHRASMDSAWHQVGLIKSNATKLIAKGTDWRFVNELKRARPTGLLVPPS